jgi:hypothetical protein
VKSGDGNNVYRKSREYGEKDSAVLETGRPVVGDDSSGIFQNMTVGRVFSE